MEAAADEVPSPLSSEEHAARQRQRQRRRLPKSLLRILVRSLSSFPASVVNIVNTGALKQWMVARHAEIDK